MRIRSIGRVACAVFIGLSAFSVPTLIAVTSAQAAQAWYCICNGKKVRHLASTRHCEYQMNVPKGQWCSRKQLRQVYGPACAKEGCVIAPFD